MTAADHGGSADLYVSNVLNGTVAAGGATVNRGTVVRIELRGLRDRDDLPRAIAHGRDRLRLRRTQRPRRSGRRPHRSHRRPPRHALYVADTAANRISAIPDATHRMRTAFTGADLSSGGSLNSPLGLTIAPNGDVLSVNAGDGYRRDHSGGCPGRLRHPRRQRQPPGAGALFGVDSHPQPPGPSTSSTTPPTPSTCSTRPRRPTASPRARFKFVSRRRRLTVGRRRVQSPETEATTNRPLRSCGRTACRGTDRDPARADKPEGAARCP